jgi:hypothetical protein
MKLRVKHGGGVRCDEAFVDGEGDFKDECRKTFISYSVPSMTRGQAKDVGWMHVQVKLVRWRGNPPAANSKKVDICPEHTKQVMSPAEYNEHKKAEREKRKAERAELRKVNAQHKREQKAAAKAAAKAKADKAKKPKAKKKSKAKKKTAGEAAPF